MKKTNLYFLLIITLSFFASPAFAEHPFLVKVYSTYQSYNAYYPWEKNKFNDRTALGTLLEGGYILTTADTVSDATYIELKKTPGETKFPASVVYVDYSCNLALLKADNEEFTQGLVPIPLGPGLTKGEKAHVYRIQNTSSIRFTEGTVEKVTVEQSYLGWDDHLSYLFSVKFDERLHWAEPLVSDKQLQGIITSYDSNRFLADVIPVEVISHFIKDVDDKEYHGFPDPGFYWEPITSPVFKEYLGLDKTATGIYIAKVTPGSTGENILKKGDILLSVNGLTIDDNGYFTHDVHGKLSFTYLMTSQYPGERCQMQVFREGKKMDLEVQLKKFTSSDYFIPVYSFDKQPRFIIEGGLVFQEVSTNYLKTWGKKWENSADKRLLYYFNYHSRSSVDDREKLVVLSFVLPDDINIGYQRFRHLIVTKINGQPIRNILDLASAMDKSDSEFLRILFEGTNEAVLKTRDLKQANERISQRYHLLQLRNL